MPSHRSPSFAAGLLALAAVTTMLFASSASAATPLQMTGKSLAGTGTWNPQDGTFTISGTATGPHAGSFVETGQFHVYVLRGGGGWYGPATFPATFTITSGAMAPITGTLSGHAMGSHCGPVGCNTYRLLNFPVAYTLSGNYSGQEPAGWPASGALVNATFRTDTLLASITENFA
jgi:hypothetical protein